ncbi:MAG: hypothetical protein RLZZ09_1550 [Pseudomonadota bacterium]
MKSRKLKLAVALLLTGAMATSVAFAKASGVGKKPPSEAAQNLSVPTILVGSLGTISCGDSDLAPSALVPPTGTPRTGYEVPGYYWVQKVHTWQTQCFKASTGLAFGNWGDNLAGDAKLKTGSPIRVELVLTNMTDYSTTLPNGLQGYAVIKLQPSLLDRLSAYGHEATGNAVSGWGSTPTTFTQAQWLVHDQGITFSVLNKDTNVYAVPPGTNPTAEINATGKIVYGYNLKVTTAGNYRIQFTTSPNVTLTGQDAANGGLIDPNNVFIDIVVGAGGSGSVRR